MRPRNQSPELITSPTWQWQPPVDVHGTINQSLDRLYGYHGSQYLTKESKLEIKPPTPIADPRLKSLNPRKILLTIERDLTANAIQKFQDRKEEKTTSSPTETQILAVLTFFKELWEMISSTDLTYTQCPDAPLTQQCESLAREYAPHVKALIQTKCLALAKQSAPNVANLSDLNDITKFENKEAQAKTTAECLTLAKQYLPTIVELDDLMNLTVHRFNLMMPTVPFTVRTTINGTVLDENDPADCQLKNIVLSDNSDAYIDVALALSFYDEAVSNLTAKALAESKQNFLLHTAPSDSKGTRKPLSETEQQRVINHSKWTTDYYKTCAELASIKMQSTHSLQTAIETLILRLRQAGVSNTKDSNGKLKFGGKGSGTHDYPGPDAKEGIDDFSAFLKPLHPSVVKKIFALKTRGDVSGAEDFGFWWNQLLTGDKCVETTAIALENILGAQTILPSLKLSDTETKDSEAKESYVSELEKRKTASKKAFETALNSKEYKLNINNTINQEFYKKIALQCHKHKITVKTIDELYSILYFIPSDHQKLEFLQSIPNLKQLVQLRQEFEAIKELFSKEFRTQGHLAQLEATFNNDQDWRMQSDITDFLLALEAEDVCPEPEPMKLLKKVGVKRIIAMLKQAENNNYYGEFFLTSLTRLLNFLNTPENCAMILNEISTTWLLNKLDQIGSFEKNAVDLLTCLMSKAKDKFLEILETINPKTLSKIALSNIFVIKTLECLPENKRYDFLTRPEITSPLITSGSDLHNHLKDTCLPIFTDEQRHAFLNQFIPPNPQSCGLITNMLPTVKALYECKLPEDKKAEFISRMLAWNDWVEYWLCPNLMKLNKKTLAENLAYLDLQKLIKIYNASLKSSSQAVAIAITQIAATKETKHTDSSTNNLMQFYQVTTLINDQLKEVIVILTPETRGKLYDAFILDLKLKTQTEPTKEWVVSATNLVTLFRAQPVIPEVFNNPSINTGVDCLFEMLRALPSSPEHRIPFLERLDIELLKKLFNLFDEQYIADWISLIKELAIYATDKLIQTFLQLTPEKLASFIAIPGMLDLLLAVLPEDQQAKIDLCRTMSATERPEDPGRNTETRRFLI